VAHATVVGFLLYGEIVPLFRKPFEFALEIWISALLRADSALDRSFMGTSNNGEVFRRIGSRHRVTVIYAFDLS
jgi:hypothetical protein